MCVGEDVFDFSKLFANGLLITRSVASFSGMELGLTLRGNSGREDSN